MTENDRKIQFLTKLYLIKQAKHRKELEAIMKLLKKIFKEEKC